MIQVSWGPEPVRTYPVDIAIRAYDRSGLLRDVSQVLLNERINVLAVNTRSNKEDNTATMQLTIEIPGLDALDACWRAFRNCPTSSRRGATVRLEARRKQATGARRLPVAFSFPERAECPDRSLKTRDTHVPTRRPAPPHGAPARSRNRLPLGSPAELRDHRPAHPGRSLRSSGRHRAGDFPQLREELGDLLFQVVYYSQLAREEDRFALTRWWTASPAS